MNNKFGFVSTFVAAVPKKNLAKYRKIAKIFSKVWLDHGALGYYEFVGQNLEKGTVTSFPRSVKLKKGEVVIFGVALFKSKAQHDRVVGKVMSDPRLARFMDPDDMPFDGMRMFWGGFKPFVKS